MVKMTKKKSRNIPKLFASIGERLRGDIEPKRKLNKRKDAKLKLI